MNKRINITVYGTVQGVFFRANTLLKSRHWQLTGWVKNETDGTVKILAEGERGKLEHLISWCQSSPGFAKVTQVDVKWEEATGEFEKFKIK